MLLSGWERVVQAESPQSPFSRNLWLTPTPPRIYCEGAAGGHREE